MDSNERIRFRVDLKSGELEVDASADKFDDVVEKVSKIIPSLTKGYEASRSSEQAPDDTTPDEKPGAGSSRRARPRASRPSGQRTSPLGAGKYRDFQPIKLGVGDAAEVELRKFYELKKPKGQDEQVSVLVYKLRELLAKDHVNYDQIYQAYRIVGEDHPPKSLAGVISNMQGKMWVDRDDNGIRLKIQGVDLVEKQLPRTVKSKAS
ncbi:MAG: hypothetical protein SGI91_01505 [Alphaproteobacteria bacterium]|nr:hypothetical protein [Alphaproteobacteria bacterium]